MRSRVPVDLPFFTSSQFTLFDRGEKLSFHKADLAIRQSKQPFNRNKLKRPLCRDVCARFLSHPGKRGRRAVFVLLYASKKPRDGNLEGPCDLWQRIRVGERGLYLSLPRVNGLPLHADQLAQLLRCHTQLFAAGPNSLMDRSHPVILVANKCCVTAKRFCYAKNFCYDRRMDTISKVRRAIEMMGGPVAAARALGAKNHQTVSHWMRIGRVPPHYCPEIERALNGEVRCEDLCPNVDWAYIRSTSSETPKEAA